MDDRVRCPACGQVYESDHRPHAAEAARRPESGACWIESVTAVTDCPMLRAEMGRIAAFQQAQQAARPA
jgi:hypothetical protein